MGDGSGGGEARHQRGDRVVPAAVVQAAVVGAGEGAGVALMRRDGLALEVEQLGRGLVGDLVAEGAQAQAEVGILEVADDVVGAESARGLEGGAADAERELVEWKKVKFMAERIGQEFDALIISTTKYGLFVELADLFIEGLIPIDTLPDDQYTYQENVRKIVGKRTRREFAIGGRSR